jgi:hypothetical protein
VTGAQRLHERTPTAERESLSAPTCPTKRSRFEILNFTSHTGRTKSLRWQGGALGGRPFDSEADS